MNRRELIAAVAAQSGADTRTVDSVLRGFTDVVTATVAKGDTVALPGFAKFAKVKRAARMGRNPQTGEAIRIKASTKARITPLKAFKDVVVGNAPAPAIARVPAKKTAAKKATAKKATAKKAVAKRAPAKKTATRATKSTGKRAAAKKR